MRKKLGHKLLPFDKYTGLYGHSRSASSNIYSPATLNCVMQVKVFPNAE